MMPDLNPETLGPPFTHYFPDDNLVEDWTTEEHGCDTRATYLHPDFYLESDMQEWFLLIEMRSEAGTVSVWTDLAGCRFRVLGWRAKDGKELEDISNYDHKTEGARAERFQAALAWAKKMVKALTKEPKK